MKTSSISVYLVILLFSMISFSCVSGVSRTDLSIEYYNLANAYFQLEKYEQATTYYLKALQYDPGLLRSSYNLARLYLEQGQFESAVNLLNSLLETDPDNLILLETLGFALSRSGRDDESLEVFRKVIELSPFNARAYYNAGFLLLKVEQYDEAAAYLEKAREIAPQDGDTLHALGLAKLHAGQTEEGISLLEEYREKNPRNTGVSLHLARGYTQTELYGKAVEAYNTYLTAHAGDSLALFEKAVVLLTAIDDSAEGMATLKKAEEAGFDDTQKLEELVRSPQIAEGNEVSGFIGDMLKRVRDKNEAEGSSTDQAVPPGT